MKREASAPYKGKVKEYIDLARVKRGNISSTKLSTLIGQSSNNYHNKLYRGTLSASELFQIADVLGCEVHFVDKATGTILI